MVKDDEVVMDDGLSDMPRERRAFPSPMVRRQTEIGCAS